ncbi:O-antigen polymerase [Siphonobacter sp. SORGH_AS_1065]|uniref:O-antigen polymerase n=1 Tax=Siphonobacter sp. SORGH_AS_1065 TaxID=3041795 RepID=UPI0027D91F94|nr:O-antigen polymerase [Siphonobacter sp. SORGH_AS_1065]
MFFTILNMISSAVCVFMLYNEDYLDTKYGLSFITTEVSLLIGLYLGTFMGNKVNISKLQNHKPHSEDSYSVFTTFSYIAFSIYTISEFVNIRTLGMALFTDDSDTVTHVNIYDGHGILMAFVTSYRLIVSFTLLYKAFVLKRKLSFIDILVGFILLISTAMSGSKSAIFSFFFQYTIMVFPLVVKGQAKRIKLSLITITSFIAFPLIIIMTLTGTDLKTAIDLLYLRILISGDIFLLGYNDEVMSTIQEKSFIHYAFYPGWGTILKYMGLNVKAPEIIGVDVFDYYYNVRTVGSNTGANSRYNYIALHFFGFYGAIIYSFLIGIFIAMVRSMFKKVDYKNNSFLSYLFYAMMAFFSNLLIDDIILFSNFMFWRILFLILTYFAAIMTVKMLKLSNYEHSEISIN